MANKFVVDTNAWIDNLDFVIEFIKDKQVVVLSHTLREMEKHKGNKDSDKKELARASRRAVRWIDENKDNEGVVFDLKDYSWSEADPYENGYVDNLIIKACIDNDYGLITNDKLLKFKALGYGLELVETEELSVAYDSEYKGFKEIEVNSDQELSTIYEDKENKLGLLVNEYLIINFKGDQHCHRWDGKELQDINLPPKRVVEPQNAHQAIALDLLWNPNIPIKFIVGTYGSGKTYLSVKTALEYVNGSNSKRSYGHLMMVRNPIGSGEAIGYLKGTKEDKTADFYKPIVQHLNQGEFELRGMETAGKLSKEIPYYMKGLSLNDTFILVDEAEDLSEKLIKLIGTRVGKKSCVVFSGDFNQAEDKYVYNNGLRTAIESLKGNPLVGIVSLQEDIRSDASKVFAEM